MIFVSNVKYGNYAFFHVGIFAYMKNNAYLCNIKITKKWGHHYKLCINNMNSLEEKAKEVVNYEIEEGAISNVILYVVKNIDSQYRATEQQLSFIKALAKKDRSHEILEDYYMKFFVSKKLASKIIDLIKSQSIIKMVKKGDVSQKDAYNRFMNLVNE